MRYFDAIKGGAIALILFSLLSIYFPGRGYSDDVVIILTVSTFLFAIFTGFFMSRLNNRLESIRQTYVAEDAGFLSFYEACGSFGKRFQNKIGDIIEKYYIVTYDTLNTGLGYKKTSKIFLELYDQLNNLSAKKIGEKPYDDLYTTLESIESSRNEGSELLNVKMVFGQWTVLIVLAGIIIFSIFSLRSSELYSQVIAVLLSGTLVLVLLIMRDLQNLRLGNKALAIESGQEIFDFMDKTRYYNQHFVNSGLVVIPKDLKKYRLGLHKPGEKPNIIVVDNSKKK